jgi:hypothetical protein
LLGAIYANRYGRASWDDIYRMRRDGMGWGQIAHAIGMHPGQFNKMRKNNRWANDRDMFDDIWRDRFDRKGTRNSDIDWARSRGMSYRDAYIADQIRRARGGTFQGTVTNHRRGSQWVSKKANPGFKRATGSFAGPSSSATKAKSSKKKGSANNFPARGKDTSHKNKEKNKGKGKGKGNGRGF